MSEQGAYEGVRETLEKWREAKRNADQVRRQFVASGPIDPSGKLSWPSRFLDELGMREIEEAEAQKQYAWDRHQEALKHWRSVSAA